MEWKDIHWQHWLTIAIVFLLISLCYFIYIVIPAVEMIKGGSLGC